MNDYRVDDLDRRIIEKLGRDARVSNRQIAAELEVAEGTIRTRIKRLQTHRLIEFAVVKDFRLAGSTTPVMLGIHADPAKIDTIAKQLADMAEINCVIIPLGRYSIIAVGLFNSVETINEMILTRIRSLEGVRRVETSIAINYTKYETGVARITKGD
ncbi:Lrp/AsnC family transcriptional regulator [Sphingomonas montanisoli]|uniref:Lrp/AsnC family transcriptional regulator n=1 Tax=Sphingomonas montanisoli TaxID=2606412 RepID=A0A5D9C777_9SPHN|nr:Lrp/AsnC family transcriptional regulator [Sphingomonas montanisoli]TZG27313.1 Lrp/AsnC family transcriptional regulator [Sphingomonas montanisoli]